MISIKMLCEGLMAVPDHPGMENEVTGIASDSRKLETGNLFVAISGFESDGHDYIAEAVRRGACGLVVEKDVGEQAVPVVRVKESRQILAKLANRFYGQTLKSLQLFGITGTNGKTTVSYLLESVLKTAGFDVGLIGTVRYRWKEKKMAAKRTTPDMVELYQLLQNMEKDGVRAVVMEVSSHALALHRVLGMQFRAAVFTNLSRDHLDFHPSLEAYGRSKANLFSMLSPNGVAVINGDDPASGLMLQSVNGRAVTYGKNNPQVDYQIEIIEEIQGKTRFALVYQGRRVDLTTRLWGAFNVMNCAAAAVVGLELGLDEKAIREGIEKIERVEGRMEVIDSSRGFQVIVDYAHTPDALHHLLIAARGFTQKRLFVLFGCGGDRDKGKRPEMGKIAEDLADEIIITSDNPRTEDPEAIIRDILSGIRSMARVVHIVDRKEAIHAVLDRARDGDTVVIAGKGHEDYQEIGSKRFPFDDRVIVKMYLGIL
ncbi:UDP-N-acetylmuramoyl-L-alanyl-D-glutamate--2,6-diaminopimelate ligase [bacterium]|nr:UDP-N-acetylmuramoyl-L-alanyl-D-glutamate--2,6-diaminopimelate ligase [bacterium]